MTSYVVELWKTSGTPEMVSRRFVNQSTVTIITSHNPGAGTHTYSVKVATHPQEGGGGSGLIGDRVFHATIHKR